MYETADTADTTSVAYKYGYERAVSGAIYQNPLEGNPFGQANYKSGFIAGKAEWYTGHHGETHPSDLA